MEKDLKEVNDLLSEQEAIAKSWEAKALGGDVGEED